MHRRKRHANHNHEIHFMAREINQWLLEGIQSLLSGSYTPRPLKQLKPTFPQVINKNCYHIFGPSGVKLATQRIRQILQDNKATVFNTC